MNASLPSQQQRETPDVSLAYGNACRSERGTTVTDQEPSVIHGSVTCRLVVQPGLVLREIAHLVASVLPATISTRTSVPADLWPIAGDPAEIHEALINVLLNARAAMRTRGRLVLSARNATVHEVPFSPFFEAQAGDYVEVAISNTGFDIYESPLDPEIGFRLARVARVLRSHGGFARITSRVGQPATVSLYFPRARIASDPIARGAKPAPHTAGTILIVDDEEAILALSRRILTRAGYSVLVACNGREALALFSQRRSEIGLVLTDLRMPGMNGFTLVWALRRSKPALRVMVATGHGTDDTHRELERLGVRQILLKPFTPQHLLDAASRALMEPVQCEPELFLVDPAASGADFAQ